MENVTPCVCDSLKVSCTITVMDFTRFCNVPKLQGWAEFSETTLHEYLSS